MNIGIIGAGNFAQWTAKAFAKIEGVQIRAVVDTNRSNSEKLANEFAATIYTSSEELMQDKTIDIVYIGSPPYLHYTQSKQALLQGKHVICEKPASLKASEANELAHYANENNLLYVVNLMQRYNPLYHFVSECIEQKLFGEFLHGYFENYACDETLPSTHWFWDKKKSGTIFIEHGVHFFDIFDGWLGKGKLIDSIHLYRSGVSNKILDRVQSTVLYNDGFVNMYHGFNQPSIADRQELRLQFEKGDITLYEWIPVQIQIRALLKNDEIEKIKTYLPNCTISEIKPTPTGLKTVKGNQKNIEFDKYVCITHGNILDKMARYEELVIAMLKDQLAWISNRSHIRCITSSNAVESIRIAEEAVNKAKVISY